MENKFSLLTEAAAALKRPKPPKVSLLTQEHLVEKWILDNVYLKYQIAPSPLHLQLWNKTLHEPLHYTTATPKSPTNFSRKALTRLTILPTPDHHHLSFLASDDQEDCRCRDDCRRRPQAPDRHSPSPHLSSASSSADDQEEEEEEIDRASSKPPTITHHPPPPPNNLSSSKTDAFKLLMNPHHAELPCTFKQERSISQDQQQILPNKPHNNAAANSPTSPRLIDFEDGSTSRLTGEDSKLDKSSKAEGSKIEDGESWQTTEEWGLSSKGTLAAKDEVPGFLPPATQDTHKALMTEHQAIRQKPPTCVVSFDCEWPKAGSGYDLTRLFPNQRGSPPSLLQLGTEDEVALIPLYRLAGSPQRSGRRRSSASTRRSPARLEDVEEILKARAEDTRLHFLNLKECVLLRDFLFNPEIEKIGDGIQNDVLGLRQHYWLRLARERDIRELSTKSTAALIEEYYTFALDKTDSKVDRIRRGNWDNPELSVEQQDYAATDVWLTLMARLEYESRQKEQQGMAAKASAVERAERMPEAEYRAMIEEFIARAKAKVPRYSWRRCRTEALYIGAYDADNKSQQPAAAEEETNAALLPKEDSKRTWSPQKVWKSSHEAQKISAAAGDAAAADISAAVEEVVTWEPVESDAEQEELRTTEMTTDIPSPPQQARRSKPKRKKHKKSQSIQGSLDEKEHQSTTPDNNAFAVFLPKLINKL